MAKESQKGKNMELKWIDADDKLPDKYADVLFLEPFTERIDGTKHIGYYDGKEWLSDDGRDIGYVTHWIPLPCSAAVIDEMQRSIYSQTKEQKWSYYE